MNEHAPEPFQRFPSSRKLYRAHRLEEIPMEFTHKIEYLELLAKYGMPAMAAQFLGLSTAQIEAAKKADALFGQACSDAARCWAEETLLQPAIQRATKGVERNVYGGKGKDTVVGTETVYSDPLLIKLLSAFHPAFRPTPSVVTPIGGGVMVLPAAPSTVDEWERQFGEDNA